MVLTHRLLQMTPEPCPGACPSSSVRAAHLERIVQGAPCAGPACPRPGPPPSPGLGGTGGGPCLWGTLQGGEITAINKGEGCLSRRRAEESTQQARYGEEGGLLCQWLMAQLWLSSSWGLLPSFGVLLQPGGLVGLILRQG